MIEFSNNSAAGVLDAGYPPSAVSQLLLTGANRGTIVKSLELMTGNESSFVEIIRTDGTEGASPSESDIESCAYATIKIGMKANDYLVLWEGFFVIPSGNRLYFRSDSTLCRAVVNFVAISTT